MSVRTVRPAVVFFMAAFDMIIGLIMAQYARPFFRRRIQIFFGEINIKNL
jgi:hypothetical protein